jgi:hypothetical protein
MTTKSYEIKVIDSEGRKLSLWILGECVDELINIYGDSEEYAKEQVENNAVANAQDRGEIGKNVWYDDSIDHNFEG